MREEDVFNNIMFVIDNKKTDNHTKIILIKALVNGVFCNLYGKNEHLFVKNIYTDKYGKFTEIEALYTFGTYQKIFILPIIHYGFTWFTSIEGDC